MFTIDFHHSFGYAEGRAILFFLTTFLRSFPPVGFPDLVPAGLAEPLLRGALQRHPLGPLGLQRQLRLLGLHGSIPSKLHPTTKRNSGTGLRMIRVW